jgi:hypothetical protein
MASPWRVGSGVRFGQGAPWTHTHTHTALVSTVGTARTGPIPLSCTPVTVPWLHCTLLSDAWQQRRVPVTYTAVRTVSLIRSVQYNTTLLSFAIATHAERQAGQGQAARGTGRRCPCCAQQGTSATPPPSIPCRFGSALAWSPRARGHANATRDGAALDAASRPPRDALLPPAPLPKRAPPRVPAAAAKPGPGALVNSSGNTQPCLASAGCLVPGRKKDVLVVQ